MDKKNEKIFSGDYSRRMWDDINNARTKTQLRYALYHVCCKLQEFECRYENAIYKLHQHINRVDGEDK